MAPHASPSMAALRRNALTVWPGMTIFGIGDEAHQSTVSGHNPDDTPGVRAELQDADTDQEWRALDFMIGLKFSTGDAHDLVDALLQPSSRARLYYIIFNRTVWHRSNGWMPRPYTGSNPHTDHVHASGWAADDENTRDWPAVLALGETMSEAEVLAALRTAQPYRDATVQAAAVAADDLPTAISLRGMVERTYGAVRWGVGADVSGETIEALTGAVAELANQIAALRTLIENLPGSGGPSDTAGTGTFTWTTNAGPGPE